MRLNSTICVCVNSQRPTAFRPNPLSSNCVIAACRRNKGRWRLLLTLTLTGCWFVCVCTDGWATCDHGVDGWRVRRVVRDPKSPLAPEKSPPRQRLSFNCSRSRRGCGCQWFMGMQRPERSRRASAKRTAASRNERLATAASEEASCWHLEQKQRRKSEKGKGERGRGRRARMRMRIPVHWPLATLAMALVTGGGANVHGHYGSGSGSTRVP